MALLSFLWTPHDPTLVDARVRLQGPSPAYWLGTDRFGRDLVSQLMVGARTTVYVGLVAVGIAALVGVPLGVLAAMAPRWLGELLMRANDLLLAFPALLLAVMLAAVLGAGTGVAMVAIGVSTVPSFARVVRAGSLQVLRSDFVLAARAAGRRPWGVAVRHVLPNVAGLVIVQASVAFAIAVLAEAALSFLGFGTPPPTPSWGRMLQESQSLLFTDPRLAVVPGVAVAAAVLGFNLLGDGLRDRLDPRLEARR
ncbi:ABC transporter permease subunit [Auraticoccus sp. F435]|uniref:ABC transporter permease subunit n=1 Tax=Auraticoccus cholistanensis TaxID=2656650 RepID=A0A6A9UY19_9ACTN|nr:ABC transporter permease [Auraticoccus cholistanensis]MVA76317.1 ABC transporter permease subunit [Auraticoccus cholistanensis]